MKIIILTGSELRHDFMRKAIAMDSSINILRTYCERTDMNFVKVINDSDPDSKLQHEHLNARTVSEHDFFHHFIELTPDKSNPVYIEKGEINNEKYFLEIKNLKPDILVAFGCSIIKEPLLSEFKGRFLNVHLGLSPYYRGAGTNFWPLVNREPEYIGATFMHINPGIDTGEVIHQIRARVYPGDSPHQIGNRLISDIAKVYIKIINCFNQLGHTQQLPIPKNVKVYCTKDFSPESVRILYNNFKNGLVEQYLKEENERKKKVRIIKNKVITE